MSTTVTYKGNTLTTVNNATKTLKTAGKYMEDDVVLTDVTEEYVGGAVYQDQDGYLVIDDSESTAPQGNLSITANGTYDVADYAGASVSVQAAPALQTKSATPTESQQTVTPDSGYDGLSSVIVDAISSTYVGSGITQRDSDDLTASGATVTVPAGYYSTQASKSIGTGNIATPTITVDSETGEITASTRVNQAGYLALNTTRSSSNQLDTQAATTITPSTSAQIAVEAGKYTIGAVTVAAMPSGTAGTPTATKGTVSNHSISVTPSVTNTAGYIAGGTLTGTAVSISASELVNGTYTVNSSGTKDVTNYASVSVPSGSATASATKGTVSNHSVTVTPRVTRTAGWVTAGSSNGTAVTVSASELVSGTLSVTENGTADVTNYASVDVSVSGGATYTATIVGNGSASYPACYVALNNSSGTKYYTDGTTFTFSYDDDLYFSANGTHAGGHITLNGVTVAGSSSSTDQASYTYETPRCNLTIQFRYGVMGNIEITVPEISITVNGQYDVSEYVKATVNVTSEDDFEADFANTIMRSGNITKIPSSITHVGSYAFYGCASRLMLSSLPSSITAIGSYAFYNCSNLSLTSLPSGITTIDSYAFYGCSSLAMTSLPSGITSISAYAFRNCTSLALTSLPSGVTTIGSYAFSDCTNLALSSLPNGLITLGTYCFQNCTNITLTSLPSGITSIPTYAFYGCTGIALTSLPSSVTSIASYSFWGCGAITTLRCEGAITTLGAGSFNGNIGLVGKAMMIEHVEFPNLRTSSLSTAFGNTSATGAARRLASADIGITSGIAANAFANCYSLNTLVLRKTDSICTLANVSAFTNTPMSGYNGLTGTVYVPSALISSYQTATNWSTLYNAGNVTFAAIEGSEYERD